MAKRRITVQGSGSIEKRKPGVWRIRFRDPRAPKDHPEWLPGLKFEGTKDEARIAALDYKRELEAQLNGEVSDMTVSEYALQWRRERESLGLVAKSTLDREKQDLERIVEAFGDIALQDLEPGDVVKAINGLRTKGYTTPTGKRKKATEHTVYKTQAKLKQILDDAVIEGVIPVNPFNSIPKKNRWKKPAERHGRNLEQAANKLLDSLNEPPMTGYKVATILALKTGMRRGEVLGLEWKHVDFENRKITIEQQLKPDVSIDGTKTEESKNDIPISSGTVELLHNWHAIQTEELGECAAVCTNTLGKWIDPTNFDRWRRATFVDAGLGEFENPEKRTGYHGFTMHDLRHTYASQLAARGCPPSTLQRLLRHTSPVTTLRIYAHAQDDSLRSAAELTDELFSAT